MKRVGVEAAVSPLPLGAASFPAPFTPGLEYSAPARGGWTIVHVGMLVPQSHEIFVCAAGCLRGVVLSAAEMNLTGRFSTVTIEEQNVLDGSMEELLIEGVTDILRRLPKLPRAVLVYSSCIHHFMGCDLEMCYRTLRERFPAVDFTDCYMIPTMRKSGLTPDQIMRRQLYSLLKPSEQAEKHCAVLGNCFSLEESSDLVTLLHGAGWTLHQITQCRTYEEYQELARCGLFLTTQPVARVGGETLAERLRRKHLYLPVGYDPAGIRQSLSRLAEQLGIPCPDSGEAEQTAERALARARERIGDTPIALDYTLTPRPLELAKLLVQRGFRVEKLFTDGFNPEEEQTFRWLQRNAPAIEVYPTVRADMRRYPRGGGRKLLALGQKAAYFTDSPYFVNLVENGGLYGFDGIRELAELMTEAWEKPKELEQTIQLKGLGCESCL